jgi:hypothetical protein
VRKRIRKRISGTLLKSKEFIRKYLWARERIARLSDYGRVGAKVSEEVKNLGLQYHLMTQYTSFVAVDTIVRDTGELVTVKQPLPLPEGVSDYAVGNNRSKVAAAPSSGFVKTLSVKEEAVYHLQDQERKREPSQLYIMGGKLPSGTTMEEVERAFSPFKEELEKVFQKWGSKKLVLLLNIEGGRVRSIEIESFQGKGYKKEVLEKILQKAIFSPSIKGKMELELVFV